MGAGIGVMHYTGMAAMRMDAVMFYDPTLFAVSVMVAVVLATTARIVTVLGAATAPSLDDCERHARRPRVLPDRGYG